MLFKVIEEVKVRKWWHHQYLCPMFDLVSLKQGYIYANEFLEFNCIQVMSENYKLYDVVISLSTHSTLADVNKQQVNCLLVEGYGFDLAYKSILPVVTDTLLDDNKVYSTVMVH